MTEKILTERLQMLAAEAEVHSIKEVLAKGTHLLALKTQDAKLEQQSRLQLHALLDIQLDREQTNLLWLDKYKKGQVT